MNSYDVFPNIYADLLLLLEEREETRRESILKERMALSWKDQYELVSSTSRHYCCD